MAVEMDVISQKIAVDIGKTMSDHIDFGLLCDVLTQSCDWTDVDIDRDLPVSSYDLQDWCEKNLKGKWMTHNKVWLFEKASDATLFILKWA